MTVEATTYSEEIEFQTSLSLEGQRIPDPWIYGIVGRKLYSPVTRKPVEESITQRNYFEISEAIAFGEFQNWCVDTSEGSIVWLSPPMGVDTSAKAVISQVLFDQDLKKYIFNRGICFDWEESTFVSFAKDIGMPELATTEDFRVKPIPLSYESLNKIMNIFRELEPRQTSLIESGEDIVIKQQLKESIAAGQSVPKGPYAPSCPSSAFSVIFKDALKIGEFFECPGCKERIPSGFGITTCPFCGLTKEKAGSVCD